MLLRAPAYRTARAAKEDGRWAQAGAGLLRPVRAAGGEASEMRVVVGANGAAMRRSGGMRRVDDCSGSGRDRRAGAEDGRRTRVRGRAGRRGRAAAVRVEGDDAVVPPPARGGALPRRGASLTHLGAIISAIGGWNMGAGRRGEAQAKQGLSLNKQADPKNDRGVKFAFRTVPIDDYTRDEQTGLLFYDVVEGRIALPGALPVDGAPRPSPVRLTRPIVRSDQATASRWRWATPPPSTSTAGSAASMR